MEALQAATGPPAAIANPRSVGRVTPCAPHLQPPCTRFSQTPPANPVVPMAFPSGSPIGTPHLAFATVPSRFVTPNQSKTINFAPVPFDHDPGPLPFCRARREECRATGTAYAICPMPSPGANERLPTPPWPSSILDSPSSATPPLRPNPTKSDHTDFNSASDSVFGLRPSFGFRGLGFRISDPSGIPATNRQSPIGNSPPRSRVTNFSHLIIPNHT
jgi:hypothetical protein